MKKKEYVLEIIQRLKKEYPQSGCSLDYSEPWVLLVSVRLAAQCTDERVNRILPLLLNRFPDISSLADANVDEIESIIHPVGLSKSKARDIKGCMTRLRDFYHGTVPDTMEDLLTLPGVGRKSANLILGDVFGQSAIVTDTHCIRLANRLGLVKDEHDPYKVEMALRKIVPPMEGNALCHRFVDHGRDVCTARALPHCDTCCLNDLCPKNIRNTK